MTSCNIFHWRDADGTIPTTAQVTTIKICYYLFEGIVELSKQLDALFLNISQNLLDPFSPLFNMICKKSVCNFHDVYLLYSTSIIP